MVQMLKSNAQRSKYCKGCNFVDFVIAGFTTNLFHCRKQNTICTYLLLIANRQSFRGFCKHSEINRLTDISHNDSFNYRGVNENSSHETCQEDSTAMVQRLNRSPGVRVPYQGGTSPFMASPHPCDIYRRMQFLVKRIDLSNIPYHQYPSIPVWPLPCLWE
jgi:hypothetical protein